MRLNQAQIDVKPIWWGCIDNPGLNSIIPTRLHPASDAEIA